MEKTERALRMKFAGECERTCDEALEKFQRDIINAWAEYNKDIAKIKDNPATSDCASILQQAEAKCDAARTKARENYRRSCDKAWAKMKAQFSTIK